ncbi:MAG: hypothetical protein H8E59_06010 [Actinobacteria bacterium]|nr:hypothetical protein [Actinomycetota bacterium]
MQPGRRVLAVLVTCALLGGGCGSASPDPIRVVTLGDSVAYDADPGIRAALESIDTGTGVEVDTRSFGGVGLLRPGFDGYLADALSTDPDVVTLMLGGWDFGEAMDDPDAYRERAEQVARRIVDSGAHLVWLGLPPTPPGEGIEAHRILVNDIFASVAAILPIEVDYVDTGAELADSQGKFTRVQFGVDGTVHPIRKVRDGKDDGHLCPAGAALIGNQLVQAIHAAGVLGVHSGGPEEGHAQGEWWTGEWTLDPRYDDPPGACDG